MTPRILIFGATSAMAVHTARRFAAEGARLFLAARHSERLEALAADLRVRGAAEVCTFPAFDARDPASLASAAAAGWQTWDGADILLIAYGTLPDQQACETDPAAAREAWQVNAASVCELAADLANRLQAQGHGTLAVISSVAGLRGRQSNYVYGAAKGAVHLFFQGLRNRLTPCGIRVVTFLPGFVDSPMTAHLPQGPLFTPADTAGRILHRQLTRGRSDICYVPGFWRGILWIIRAIPECLFKKLRL